MFPLGIVGTRSRGESSLLYSFSLTCETSTLRVEVSFFIHSSGDVGQVRTDGAEIGVLVLGIMKIS